MPGPPPKPDRKRRNADPIPPVSLAADGQVRGPELPDVFKDGWPEPTESWWDHWRRSAQAQVFSDTDWDSLAETALLHARFWTGDVSVAGELRLRVAKFGATIEDRLRLRMSIGDEAPAPAKPTPKRRGNLKVVDSQAS